MTDIIDDRLPIGLSYNLQYNVATVSVMHFLSIRKAMRVNVSENLGALLDAVQIDGDINYLGEGLIKFLLGAMDLSIIFFRFEQ